MMHRTLHCGQAQTVLAARSPEEKPRALSPQGLISRGRPPEDGGASIKEARWLGTC